MGLNTLAGEEVETGMKRRNAVAWICLAVLILGSIGAAAQTKGTTGVDRLFARFVMERKVAALSASLRSEGRVTLGGPGKVRFETLSPSKSILIVNGGKAWLSYPDLKVTKSFELASDPVMQVLTEHILAMSAFDFSKLAVLYDVTDIGDSKKKLVPKQEAVRRVFAELRVTLDSRGLATTVEMISVSGDSTLITFSQIDTQPKLDASTFAAPGESL